MAALVHDHDAIAVTVERNADIRPHLAHLLRAGLRRGRAAFMVDVESIRIDADRYHFGAQFPQRHGRDFVGRAVCAIDHNAQACKRLIARQRPFGEFDIAILRAVDALDAADVGRLRQALAHIRINEPLDFMLDLIGKLVTIRAE